MAAIVVVDVDVDVVVDVVVASNNKCATNGSYSLQDQDGETASAVQKGNHFE